MIACGGGGPHTHCNRAAFQGNIFQKEKGCYSLTCSLGRTYASCEAQNNLNLEKKKKNNKSPKHFHAPKTQFSEDTPGVFY